MMEPGQTKKILIADDEAYIRLLIEQSLEELEDEGVQVLTAKNGMEAVRITQEELPQMVILDVMMPQMSGFEVCRKIKKELCMQDVFIVMLTAKGQETDRQESEAVGANLYMTKPFDPNELLELATRVIRK
jgi:two-component system, OmpR family, alkaline phosphatase synthesis response regulator PhoP